MDAVGPVSIQNLDAIFKAYQEQRYTAGLLMLVSLLIVVLLGSMLASQRRSAAREERTGTQFVEILERAIAAMGASTSAAQEVRRSLESNTAEMRAGNAATQAELRLVESAIGAAAVETERGREAVKDHVDVAASRVIQEVQRCAKHGRPAAS